MKTLRKKLIDKLDDVASSLVKERDHHICQMCDKPALGSNCHWSHVIPRSKGNALRWDLQNSMVLCYHCHINVWHKNPLESAEWFRRVFPDRWEYLQKHKHDIVQYKTSDLEELLDRLKGVII